MVGQGLWILKTLVRVLHPNVDIGVDYRGRLKLSALLLCNSLVNICSTKRVLFAAAMKNGAVIDICLIGEFCNVLN